MTKCKDCERIQDWAFDKNIPTSPKDKIPFIKIDNGFVALVGCEKHVEEIFKRMGVDRKK